MGKTGGVHMSTYKENLISLLPYGKTTKGCKASKDKKGHTIVKVKNGKKWKKYKFNKDAGVIL